MNRYHSPHHWIWVVIVVVIALLTLSNAHGRRTDSSAMFEGRPAMAGAQAGTGAMAGLPQGAVTPDTDAVAADRAVRDEHDMRRDRDPGVAKDRRSLAQRVRNAVRRIVQRARHGVSDRDIQTAKQQ